MTPLIDVVFLLLVFFMLASTFVKYTQIDVAGSNSQKAANVKPGAVFVRVHEGGIIDLNGSPLELSRLTEALDAHWKVSGARVIVRPMENTDVQSLVRVLEKIRRSKIEKIIVAR